MTTETAWTIKRLLDWTVPYFEKNESLQPRLDAEILLAEALGCQRIELYTRFDEEVAEGPRSKFREWVKRRAEGVPVAYLVGHREFFSLEFEVNKHVLIPRPETEHLVTSVLDLIGEHFANQPKIRIVEVGTGCGCIAIAVAKHCEKATVEAIDISAEALDVAKRNVETHQLESRVQLIQGDLLDVVQDADQVDMVVSNPPYVGLKETSELAPEVKDNEPHVALFSDDDEGVGLSQKIMQQMVTKGCGRFLVMESSPMIIGSLSQYAKDCGFEDVEVHKDFGGLERWIVAKREKSQRDA